jgi:hypothetical protein
MHFWISNAIIPSSEDLEPAKRTPLRRNPPADDAAFRGQDTETHNISYSDIASLPDPDSRRNSVAISFNERHKSPEHVGRSHVDDRLLTCS